MLTIDVNGRECAGGAVWLLGKARYVDGEWRALADVDGSLCVVVLKLSGPIVELAQALFGWLEVIDG